MKIERLLWIQFVPVVADDAYDPVASSSFRLSRRARQWSLVGVVLVKQCSAAIIEDMKLVPRLLSQHMHLM